MHVQLWLGQALFTQKEKNQIQSKRSTDIIISFGGESKLEMIWKHPGGGYFEDESTAFAGRIS